MKFETLSIEDLSAIAVQFRNEELLSQTSDLVTRERELTVRTLVLFREIEKRMIHLELGFSSLFDMLVKYFGMSEGSASRRVASVRMMAQVPGVEAKIQDGSLSLSNVAAAQRFFNAEAKNEHPLPLEKKKEVLDALVGKSAREAEKELIHRSSSPVHLQFPDQVKPKGNQHVEIRFVASEQLGELLEEAKGLLAHRVPQATLADVIQYLAEKGIEKLKKERFGAEPQQKRSKNDIDVDVENENKSKSGSSSSETPPLKVPSSKKATVPAKRSRFIPARVRRTVYNRAQGRCEYVDLASGKRCNHNRHLEFHHKTPFARGGQHTVECIQLCCKAHNLLQAMQDFTEDKIRSYFHPK